MKYTARMKAAAEVTIRKSMSAKARRGYDDTGFVEVYEYDTDDGPRYAVVNGLIEDGLTFDQAEKCLESYVFPDPPEDSYEGFYYM